MRQQMMLSLHGKPSDVDAFRFHLAEKLGCMVADLDRMTAAEYIGWQAYYEAKASFTNMKKVI